MQNGASTPSGQGCKSATNQPKSGFIQVTQSARARRNSSTCFQTEPRCSRNPSNEKRSKKPSSTPKPFKPGPNPRGLSPDPPFQSPFLYERRAGLRRLMVPAEARTNGSLSLSGKKRLLTEIVYDSLCNMCDSSEWCGKLNSKGWSKKVDSTAALASSQSL